MTTRTQQLLALLDRLKNDPDLLAEATELAKDTAVSSGLLLRLPNALDTLKPAPVTLLPTVLSGSSVGEIIQIQSDINLLMHSVAHDRKFLTTALQGAAGTDLFIKNLLDIYGETQLGSQWELGLIRSDYILHQTTAHSSFQDSLADSSFKQVEINMICIGLAGLGGSRVRGLHDRVLNFLGCETLPDLYSGAILPMYGEALRLAYNVYCKNHPSVRTNVVLIVIHRGFEFNIVDQRLVEFESAVPSLRRSFEQIARTAVVQDDGVLVVDGREVAVVYYRTGYAPAQYDGPKDWETRLILEKSQAIKCPSVGHQLAGFKKIQQELSKPEVLQKFLPNTASWQRLMRTFMGQWDLSDPAAADAIDRALTHPTKFVLKPNREGGGNNFYGSDMTAKVRQLRGTDEARQFVLMELIEAPVQENYLIRPQVLPERVDTVNEIGVFGVILAKQQEVLINLAANEVLIRSKAAGVHEGGVATGHSCLSSSFFV